MTDEQYEVLVTAPLLEVVAVPGGFGCVVPVMDDDDPTIVQRTYLISDDFAAANAFCAMLKGVN